MSPMSDGTNVGDGGTGLSIRVSYWAGQVYGEPRLEDLEGIEEFRRALSDEYVSSVHGSPGDRGFLYDLTVELLSNLSLRDLGRLLVEGAAYDIIKSGSKA